VARLELRGDEQPGPELRCPGKGSGVSRDEGVHGEHEGAVRMDARERRLERTRTAVGGKDVFTDDRGPVFPPTAGGHSRPAATHQREREVGDNLGHVFHTLVVPLEPGRLLFAEGRTPPRRRRSGP